MNALFFNDTATTEIYTLALHDALPISCGRNREESMAVPSSMSGARLNGTQSAIIELIMVRIPEGWFGMGCESGRDDEKRWGERRVGKECRAWWGPCH